MKKYYSGIGARTTPNEILKLMTKIAYILDNKRYILRSGGALGADTAFANGSNNKEIFYPKNATTKAIKMAMEVHPAPHNCNSYVKKLHGRNAQIILGQDLNAPSEFIIVWTPGGKIVGGSGLGIRIAKQANILVYNLFNKSSLNATTSRFFGEINE